MEPLNPVTKRWLIYVAVFFATVGVTQVVRAVDPHNMGVVGLTLRHGDAHPVVEHVVPNFPGAKAHIAPGDAILAIDGKDTAFMCERQVVWALRGSVSQMVTLTIRQSDGEVSTIKIRRKWPGDLPEGEDKNGLFYTSRPFEVDRPFDFPKNPPCAVAETPYCLASDNGAIVEFEDLLAAKSLSAPGFARLLHGQAELPGLYCKLSMGRPEVRDFAAHFGITRAPAYIFVGPTHRAQIGEPLVMKDPIQQNQRQALPPYRNGCEVDLGWTAVPGKLVSTSSKF